MNLQRIRLVVGRHRIIYGVIVALAIAFLLTMVSMALYISSGASRLDLSRPGYEKAREEITKDTDMDEFSSSGSITTDTLDDFQKRFDKRRTELNGLGAFSSTALDDNQLQIAPTEDPSVQ